jgi:tetratricopeptide (TPR) repeat protein
MQVSARAPLAVVALLSLAAAASARPGGEGKPDKPEPVKEQFKDEVMVRGARGSLTGVEVVYEGWDKVDWKAKGGAIQSRPAAEVISLKYADQPTYFTRGLEAFRAGRWADAETELRGVSSAVAAGKARKFWDGRANAYVGECRRRQALRDKDAARFKTAQEAFQDALKVEPRSPLADMIAVGIAECMAGGGDWDGALKYLDDFKKTATDAGRPAWEARARLARGRLLERKGEVGGAAGEYLELAKFAEGAQSKTPADSAERRDLDGLRVNGLVSAGWALYARAEKTKSPADLDAARKHFAGLATATGGSPAGRAASLNGLGGILLLEGKPRAALEKFVEVEVTMFAVPEEVARALWQKSQACERLGNSLGREAALKDLVEFYPWSEWAGRAH